MLRLRIEELNLRLTKPSLAGNGAELGNNAISDQFIFVANEKSVDGIKQIQESFRRY